MRADVPLRSIFVGLGFGALALLGGARAATAQTNPNCNDTTMFPSPIYLAGSSAFEPTASQIAVKLAKQATPYTLIYKATASCDGPSAIRDNVTLTGNGDHFIIDPADAAGVRVLTQQCVLDPAGVTTKAVYEEMLKRKQAEAVAKEAPAAPQHGALPSVGARQFVPGGPKGAADVQAAGRTRRPPPGYEDAVKKFSQLVPPSASGEQK